MGDAQGSKLRVLQRILSALVLAPVVLVLIWVGGWWLVGLIAVAVLIGIHEMVTIFEAGKLHPRLVVAWAIGLAFVAAAVFQHRTTVELTAAALTFAVLAALIAEIMRRDRAGSLAAWTATLGSGVYVGMLLTFFLRLRALDLPTLGAGPLDGLGLTPGIAWVIITCAVTWASDTGAYFTGRALGRHKMAPLLSPKKTWEGFVGGLLAAVLAGIGIAALLGLPVSTGGGIGLGLIGAVGGTCGDLAESLLKRQAGVKDSGKLIPGHGGLLDRIDSLLFTGPLVFYLAQFLIR